MRSASTLLISPALLLLTRTGVRSGRLAPARGRGLTAHGARDNSQYHHVSLDAFFAAQRARFEQQLNEHVAHVRARLREYEERLLEMQANDADTPALTARTARDRLGFTFS